MIQEVILFAEKVERESAHGAEKCLQPLVHLAHLLALLFVETGDNRLDRKFRHTLRLVTASLEAVCVLEGVSRWHTLHPVLASLTAMVEGLQESAGEVSRDRYKQILSSMPPALPAVLLSLLEKRCVRTTTATASTQITRGTLNQSSFDDFDLEFDDTLPGPSSAVHEEIMDFEDDSNQADEEQVDENIVVDDITTLSQRDQCVVVAGRWLVAAAAAATPPGGGGGGGGSGGDTQHTFLHKAVDVVLQMSLRSAAEMCDVAVLLAFVQSLFVADYSEDNILDGLEVISNIAKVHCGVTQVARCSLHYLADLICKHGCSLSPDIRTSILTLVKAFAIKHQQGNYDKSVTRKIFDVNMELTKVDPKRTWSHYEIPDHDRCGKIVDLLNSKTNELRLRAAVSVRILVIGGGDSGGGDGGGVIDAQHQDRVFEEVYQIVLESLNVSDSPNEDLLPDERRNRCASFLLSLGCLAASSPYLESKALFALCLSVPVYKIEAPLLLQLLTCISKAKRTSPQQLLASNLQYLTSQWLQHRHSITAFPSTAFGYKTAGAFLAEHRSALLPVLLECDAKEGIEELAEGCEGGVKGLFKDAFPFLMARVFPYIAAEGVAAEGMRLGEAKIQAGRRQYKQIERTFGTEVFTNMLTTHIGDITLHLLRLAHDPQPWVEGEVVVPPPPPSFPPEVIQATMKFIGGIFRKDGQLVAVVWGRRELHGVVQGVVQGVGRSTSPEAARRAITATATLVEAALPLLAAQLAGAAHYLLRMLLHLLTAHLEPLSCLGPHLVHRCLALLHRVVTTALNVLPGHLAPAVPVLFGRLLPLLTQPRAVGVAGAAGVLELLLDCEDVEVRAALAALPAMPSPPHCPALAALREQHHRVVAACRGRPDLCDEVDNFLATPPQAVATHHLAHMASLLQNTRDQVAELFGGTGPGRESRGHRLAHRLVSLAASKVGAVAQEACRCLGELGPLSLATPVFLVSEGEVALALREGEVDLGYVGRLLLALHGYLACGEVEVEEAAAQALQGVLATQQGQAALQELPPTAREELRPLLPEGRSRAGVGAGGGVDGMAYQQIVGAEGVWEVGEGGYEAWVCGLARCLITAGCGTEVAPPLLPLCALRPEFSALALPLLVHSALATDPGGRRDVLSRQMSAFFTRHSQDVGGRAGRAAVQAGLAVVEHLRLQQLPPMGRHGRRIATPFDTNQWLALNYLQVAGAAHHCGAHFSALLYLQLHHEQMVRDSSPEHGTAAITRRLQGPPCGQVAGHAEAAAAGQLLLQVCRTLGDGAGVQGCIAAGVVQDTPARLALCHHRGDWLAALALCDAAHHRAGLHHTLAALGLHHTLGTLLTSRAAPHGPMDPSEGRQARWEAAWRLCRWEEDGAAGRGGVGEEGRPHRHIFEALRCLHYHDLPALHHHTTAARTAITTTLSLSRAESTSLMYPILTHLQVLNEIEDAARCVGDLSCPGSNGHSLLDLEEAWRGKEDMGTVGYKHKEEVMAARVSVLKALTGVCEDGRKQEVEGLLHRTLLAKSKLARESGDRARGVVASEAAVLWASQLAVPPKLANLTRLEEAEVARAAGDVQRARHTLTGLLRDMEGQEGLGQQKVLSQALTFLGELLMEARSLPPRTIIEEYFNRATATLLHHDTDKESQDILETSHQHLAQYADQLYQQVHSHLESDASQAKRTTIQRSRAELQRLDNLVKGCREKTADWNELKKKMVLLQRNINIDVEFLSELEREEQTYLLTALKAHLTCLAMTSTHHLLTYRVVALWLQNCAKEEVNAMMSEHGCQVKSHHFVPLLYQLVARLSTHNAHLPLSFPSVLSQLLLRVCGDHPHHTLPVIYALAHAHADDQFQTTGRRKEPQVTEEDRVQAAKQLVDRLKRIPTLRDHVVEFETISLAYLSLANWCGSLARPQTGDKIEIPSNQPLRNLPAIRHTASLTQPLPLQPSAQYSPPLLQDWEGAGMCVGGINAPIRLTARTSDGAKNFELLKGRDDVRQDAVMEQVPAVCPAISLLIWWIL
ncbi:serine-protein kinase ATM-like isoform X2 [Scylla paramamosain]|uniref:serine-protein kinase ATM-like isoform X2 n=1 Tax=Scylla paramamosain TaxID=85552 RepID=UPI003083E827